MSVAEVMAALEQAGTAQTRKTYARHGAVEPMFGVLASAMKPVVKRIGVDHELALALWETRNHDACTLAAKIADPQRITPDDLDRWAATPVGRPCHPLIAQLAVDGPHARGRAEAWLAHGEEAQRSIGWSVVGGLALRDEGVPDAWFKAHLDVLERTLNTAANGQRSAMNHALIAIGCRSPSLRRAAVEVADRVGKVAIDHGDTACKTPAAAAAIDKAWAYSTSKGFVTPAAHERSRESVRTRC